jgi:hypothetical protein
VVASRSALTGGAPATTVTLPQTQLGQASYTIDVRVVNRINPGQLVEAASPQLARAG